MKTQHLFLLLLFSVLSLHLKCKKEAAEVETLPPITQNGANTFGCLVNGKVWVPKGLLFSNKLKISYDPGWRGGTFNISAYRKDDNTDQAISIYSDMLDKQGIYSLYRKDSSGAKYLDNIKLCWYDYKDVGTQMSEAELIITKLDLSQRIISGTFYFTYIKSGCDTIKVTNGRFDLKL